MLIEENTLTERSSFVSQATDDVTSRTLEDARPDLEEERLISQEGNPRSMEDTLEDLVEKKTKVFALLIAIDHYDLRGANLGGCVKDSLAVEQYLRDNIEEAGERLHLFTLRSPLASQADQMELEAPQPASRLSGEPTRTATIEAFMGFLGQARTGDAVLVHYSGHGSFETRPPELWHLDAEETSEHRAETLVCKDSFTTKKGAYIPALRDKELRWLLARVADQGPHVVMLMDCCNSAGNTRFKEEGTLARFTEPQGTADKNNIKTYVFYQLDAAVRKLLTVKPTDFQLPEGRHVALYACHSYQLAKETTFPEGRFGVFTYYLLQTLRATRGNISYRDLLKLVRAKASLAVTKQSPQWHFVVPADGDLLFLGGTSPSATPAYTLTPTSNPQEASLDAGSLHGLVSPAVGETYFTVFSANEKLEKLDPTKIRQAKLLRLEPDHSILTFTDGQGFPAAKTLLKAIVAASPLAKTRVCIELEVAEELVSLTQVQDAALRERLRAAQQKLTSILQDHAYLELVEKSAANWQYRLFIYVYQGEDKLRITEKDSVNALIAPRRGWAGPTMQALVAEMTHIAKWERTLSLQNPNPTIIQPGTVSLEVIDKEGQMITDHGGEIVLPAAVPGQPHPRLKFKAVLHQPLPMPLHCAIVHLRPDFAVNPGLLPADAQLGKIEYLDGGTRIKFEQKEIYAGSHVPMNGRLDPTGLYLEFSLPPTTGELPIDEVVDYFKLIVSTEQFDAMHLFQNNLERANVSRAGRKPADTRLDSLLSEVQLRDAGWATASAAPPKKISDWWTTTVAVKTMRQLP